MQVQSINGQSYSTNKQQARQATHPSFGVLLTRTEEFEKANLKFGIQDKVESVLLKFYKKHSKLKNSFLIDKGAVYTEHGDTFGRSMSVFASRRPDDLKWALTELAEKSNKLNELTGFVEKFNKSNKGRIEFEKDAIKTPVYTITDLNKSPDNVLFNDISDGSKPTSFKNVKASIKDAAKALSKLRDRDDYTLMLGFDDKEIGVVKARLVNNYDPNLFRSFDLAPKHNSKTLQNAIGEMKGIREKNIHTDDPTWNYILQNSGN